MDLKIGDKVIWKNYFSLSLTDIGIHITGELSEIIPDDVPAVGGKIIIKVEHEGEIIDALVNKGDIILDTAYYRDLKVKSLLR